MPVRKTESRLPDSFTAADLGQFAATAGNKIALVSFFSSPCALRQTQVYVVFVVDTAVAGTVGKYDWTFTNGGTPTQLTTDAGIAQFTPQNLGALTVTVELNGSGGGVLQTLNLSQQVIALNNDLEVLIDQQESNAPDAAHPDTSREIVNDVRGYIDVMLPGAANELYNKALSSLAYARCMKPEPFRRHLELERIANVINTGNHKDFLSETKTGFGICKTRPQMLAMFLKRQGSAQPYINLIELPDAKSKRPAAEKDIAKAFNDPAVTEEHKIDLFNLLRFPKSHLTMVKLVIDELRGKYFPSATTVPDVLKEKAKAGSLLTQFEIGPIVMGGSFGVTGDSSKVVKLFGHRIWTIKVAPIAGAAGGGGGTVVPGPVGTPEIAPDVTFIAFQSPSNPPGKKFLAQAKEYHRTFGLNPQDGKSFEDILRILAQPPLTPIARLRVVSHFALDDKSGSAIFIPIFDNLTLANGKTYFHAESWHFEYGKNDAAGLLAYFQNELLLLEKPDSLSAFYQEAVSTSPGAKPIALHAALFRVLKSRSDPSLAPFKFGASGPSGAALTLFQWAGGLFALDHGRLSIAGKSPDVNGIPLPAPLLTAYKTFARAQIDKLKTSTGVMSAANVDGVVAAVTALGMGDLPVPGGRTSLGGCELIIAGTFLLDHTSLRTDLATVRTRLQDAVIDVRGCSVGLAKDYMGALRTFFGVASHEPSVSGPTWLQSFTVRGLTPVPDETTIDASFKPSYASSNTTGADVQRAYQDWSGMVGLGAQLSFWTQLFDGNKIAFLARTWTARVPPLGMDAAAVTGLSALSYPDLLTRLRSVFFIDPSVGPTAGEAGAFNTSSMGNVVALNTEIDAVDQLPANATQPALQARLTALQAVATSMGQTLPAAPNPLTIDFLKACITQLSGPLVTASKIDPLLTALHVKANDPNFGIRYMMGAGLPLIVQSAKNEAEISVFVLQARLTDALKSLAKIHWKQPPPQPVIAAISALNPVGVPTTGTESEPTNDTARVIQFSLLTKDKKNSEVAINPEDEFASLIARVP
jgi:hypothetical protein